MARITENARITAEAEGWWRVHYFDDEAWETVVGVTGEDYMKAFGRDGEIIVATVAAKAIRADLANHGLVVICDSSLIYGKPTTPNPATEGVEAAAYICERCEEETAETFAWDDEAERLYPASGEVVRGEWYPICHECNDARQA